MTYIAITADYAKLRKVRRALRLKGVEAYLPAIVHHRPVVKSAKIRYRRRVTPLMSYILARAPDHPAARDLWLYDVLQTKGVRGYVKFIDRPALIDEKHIADLKAAVLKMRRSLDNSRHKRWLRTGSKASIETGTLAGKTGTIQWIKKLRVGLEAKIFGAMRVVEVPVSSLRAA